MLTLRRLSTVGSLVVGLVFAAQVTASAAEWDFTRNSPNGGAGHTNGHITFSNARNLDYVGITVDKCPPDSLGTSFYVLIDESASGYHTSPYEAIDNNGCDNGLNGGGSGTWYSGSTEKIVQAKVFLCWTNDGDPCYLVEPSGSSWKSNPHYP
jgi:hypothetical protein